ncbi:MAG: CBS domain-containing protein [Hyphomicrobium sp.]|jgi:CBS domain-containing protein
MKATVKTAMHNGAEWVGPQTSVTEIAKKMRELDIGSIPVGENDRLIGMVTDRDIICRCVADGRNASDLTARDVMTEGIIYCRDRDSIDEALGIMEKRQVRRLPVIDDNKRMVGILSFGDISHAAPPQLAGHVLAACSAHHN